MGSVKLGFKPINPQCLVHTSSCISSRASLHLSNLHGIGRQSLPHTVASSAGFASTYPTPSTENQIPPASPSTPSASSPPSPATTPTAVVSLTDSSSSTNLPSSTNQRPSPNSPSLSSYSYSSPPQSTARFASGLNTSSTTLSSSSFQTPDASAISRSTEARGGANTRAIVGGVIGGVVALLVLLALLLFLRRRKLRHRTAPSSEFLNVASGRVLSYSPSPGLALLNHSPTPDDGITSPPPFTPGNYNDPIFEKLHAATAQRHQYQTYDPGAGLVLDHSEEYSDEKGEEREWIAH